MNLDMAKAVAGMIVATGLAMVPALTLAQTGPANAEAAQATSESAQSGSSSAGQASGPAAIPSGDASDAQAASEAAVSPSTENDAAEEPEASVDTAAVPEKSAEQIAADIKQMFENEFPGIRLDGVRETRFAGVYELRIGTDLLYTNAAVDYVLQGTLIDARNKEDLTAKRLDELTRVDFDSLPLESAIKQVKGDGSRKMAVFEDPNCGYCKRLHQTLEGMDNYTVYTLLFPILSPDSTAKARNIWCAPDRVQAWRDQMLKNQPPPNAQCETPIEANLAFG
ncbi:DsbC family protein, partial [Pusillimonas sp. (ex Stolz et al. 2005)]|uniref:DsbC family protein n=1 Tax=Pusillimonas sp. (ex Stolz et al. 2005) TaxID=1979962 RepID=UPI00262FAF9F